MSLLNECYRYIHTFDQDRSALPGGYADDAIFSVRVPRGTGASTVAGPSRESDFRFAQGPGPISEALTALGPHKFCPRGIAGKVHYDVVSLNSDAGGGILLTVHGEVADESVLGKDFDHTFSISQSFVLQRNMDKDRCAL